MMGVARAFLVLAAMAGSGCSVSWFYHHVYGLGWILNEVPVVVVPVVSFFLNLVLSLFLHWTSGQAGLQFQQAGRIWTAMLHWFGLLLLLALTLFLCVAFRGENGHRSLVLFLVTLLPSLTGTLILAATSRRCQESGPPFLR